MNKLRLQKVALFVTLAGILGGSLALSSVLFAASNNMSTTNIVLTPQYRSMGVDWSSYTSTVTTQTAFAVYRADDAQGTNGHRIALLNSSKKSYKDILLTPGSSYAYAVVVGDSASSFNTVATSTLNWTALATVPTVGGKDGNGNAQLSPHRGAGGSVAQRNQKGCNKCHIVHDTASTAMNLIKTQQSSSEPNAATALCESCHMSSTASEKQFVSASLTQTSGHSIKNAQNSEGVLECITCHGPHQNSGAAKGALVPRNFLKFGSLSNSILIDASAQNAACIGCHDDNNTWWKATHSESYPSTSQPATMTAQSPATGMQSYPATGTFPGASVANSATQNGHSNIASFGDYDKGDCRYCHSGHANGVTDQLLSDRGELRAMKSVGGVVSDQEKMSGDYASFCLSCHNSSNSNTPWSSAADIAQYVMVTPGSSDSEISAFLKSHAGHRIQNDTGVLPAGSSLPCYACHNPHGSQTNAFNFSDELGVNLKDDRNFCMTCHVTSDGYVCEDGNQGSTVLLKDAKRQDVFGIPRSSGVLQLPSRAAHDSTSNKACNDCHINAHAPR